MTVESTNSKQLPQQMGINTEYPFTLDVLLEDPTEEEAKSAIKAKIKLADNTELDLIYNDPGENGYQVVLNSNRLGGKVIVNNKRTILDYITIYRYYQMKQEADYQDFNAAPADTFEQSYDKLTMIDQQQQEVLDRCVKVEMTSNVDPENFTEHVERIYESIDNVDTVSGIKQEVVTTAENIESIINCSENIQSIIDAPQQAQNAAVSANNSLQSENNAEIWAEGTDEEVQALGGEHSSKRWAEMSSGGSWADKDLSNITEAGKDVIRNTAGSGFSLFDLVVKDHILSYEESKGLALQGTYVYKDAVPGSRYGYPDFYNRCVEEFEDGGNTLLSIKNNVSLVGAPVVDNGVISGFSTSNYATALTFPTDEDFVFEFKIKTGADISGEQEIFACPTASGPAYKYYCLLNLNSNNLWIGFNGGEGVWPYGFATPAQPETDYIVKVVYSKTNNTLHVTMSLANGTVLLDDTKQVDELYDIKEAVIGVGKDTAGTIFNPFKGSVDLKECYIESNGQRIWSGASVATKNPNGHIFYDIADKATVDEIFSQRGEAWFYGVDTENERIFLPRGTRSQYTVNTDETGDYVEAGLPNIEGVITGFSGLQLYGHAAGGYSSGCIKGEGSARMNQGEGNFGQGVKIDASLSSPIYGKSDTVQPYATKKLLYIVVGNVKVQSAASDVVDVTTSENDTLPLFYNFYAKDEDMADAVSFVKSTGTFLGGNLYPTAYEKLVARVGTGNVKAHTDDYTDYDFVVNQDEMTFRLPLKNGKEVLPGNETVNTLGFSANPTNNVEEYIVPYNGYITIIGYKQSTANTLNVMLNGVIVSQTRALVGGLSSESYFFAKKGDRVTVFTDSASTGWVIATQTITKAIGDGNLYYKLLNAVVNQELVDVGQVMNSVNTLLPNNTSLITSYVMPDYTAGVTKAVGQEHIATTDGVASFSGYSTAQTAAIFYVNGVKLTYAAPQNQMDTSSQILVPKGATYRLSTANNAYANSFLTFYPLKGAN